MSNKKIRPLQSPFGFVARSSAEWDNVIPYDQNHRAEGSHASARASSAKAGCGGRIDILNQQLNRNDHHDKRSN
jgi:hypothetical protein